MNKYEKAKVKVGDTIKIIEMKDEPSYEGRTGKVTHIDAMNQIHGTWGGCAIIPEVDEFIVIKEAFYEVDAKAWIAENYFKKEEK